MIIVQYCRTLISDPEPQFYRDECTIQEIVDDLRVRVGVPKEFDQSGVACIQANGEDMFIPRENWRLVRPKPNTGVFISTVPMGGGKQGTKTALAIVAAIALIAVTSFISAGGLSFLAPALLAKGMIGASIAAGVVGAGGAALIGMLTAPKAGAAETGGGDGGLGSAGINQNTVGAFAQLPVFRGKMLASPPLVARPYTETDGKDMTIVAVAGGAGPCAVENIKINGIPIEAYSSDQLTYEVREGWEDDPPLTLVERSGFEESPNDEFPKHRFTPDDGSDWSELEPNSSLAYPKPLLYRTCRNPSDFRMVCSFPGGLYQNTDGSPAATGFKIRFRKVGSPTWIQGPFWVLRSRSRDAMRHTIWVHWDWTSQTGSSNSNLICTPVGRMAAMGGDEGSFNAHPWWGSGGSTSAAANVRVNDFEIHIYMDKDGTMTKDGQWVIEITKGYNSPDGNIGSTIPTVNDDGDTWGFFSYFRTDLGQRQVKAAWKVTGACVVQSYTSFRNEYPINETGVCMIAVRGKNMSIQSIAADFTSYAAIWDGSQWLDNEEDWVPTSNPAALLRDTVFNGSNNEIPLDTSLLDSLDDWYEYCETEGYTCNAMITTGTVEKAVSLIAQNGNAALRRNGKWGVVIDRDLSGEGVVQLFNSMNMTSPLSIQVSFKEVANLTRATFYDIDNEYQPTEVMVPMDGFTELTATLTEATSMEGKTNLAEVERQALMNMRRAKLRRKKYTFDTKRFWLRAQKGQLVGVLHPTLSQWLADGRVLSWTESGGNFLTITLDTTTHGLSVTPTDFFANPNVFGMGNVIGDEVAGLSIELPDATVITLAITGIVGTTFTIGTGHPVPANFKERLNASVGKYTQEYRRMIIAGITPKDGLGATVTLIDEAPGIHEGF